MAGFKIKRIIQQELNLSPNDLPIIEDQINAIMDGWQYKITSVSGYRYNFESADCYIPKHEVVLMTHQGWVEIVENDNGLVLEMEYTVDYSGEVIMFFWIGFIGITTNLLAYWGITFLFLYSIYIFYRVNQKCRQMLLQMSRL